MNSVKIILIAMESAMIICAIMIAFLTDWTKAVAEQSEWLWHLLLIGCTSLAIVLQSEQQKIHWENNDEE